MQVIKFLLDDQPATDAWGSSLKMLISLLVMLIVGIGIFIWWAKRG
jgi:hypothetical protein